MLLRPLGRTNLMVPVIGMGTSRTFDVRGAEEEETRAYIASLAAA